MVRQRDQCNTMFIQYYKERSNCNLYYMNYSEHIVNLFDLFCLMSDDHDWVAQRTIKVNLLLKVLLKLIVNYFCCRNVNYS